MTKLNARMTKLNFGRIIGRFRNNKHPLCSTRNTGDYLYLMRGFAFSTSFLNCLICSSRTRCCTRFMAFTRIAGSVFRTSSHIRSFWYNGRIAFVFSCAACFQRFTYTGTPSLSHSRCCLRQSSRSSAKREISSLSVVFNRSTCSTVSSLYSLQKS